MVTKTSNRDSVPGFGERVRALRVAAGLKQYELAAKAGVKGATLADLENGRRSPSVAVAVKVARGLGVTLCDLVPAGWVLSKDRKKWLKMVDAGKPEGEQHS